VEALSTRWSAPSEEFSQIENCTVSWRGQRIEDLDDIVAAFRPRAARLAEMGITLNVR
jgi:hypothetical protein